MAEIEISYKLEHFEGPLDLLLHLIEKNKVNIYDIPIVEITNQYLDYVHQMEREDLNLVSDFLVMAATLIDIKSRMLLPKEEEGEEGEEDPRAELVARLLEYKKYKYISQELAELEDSAGIHFYKAATVPPEVAKYEPPVDLDKLLDGLTLAKLQAIFQQVIKRKEDKVDRVRSSFGTIKREPVSLEMKIGSVMAFARKNRKFSFRQILETGGDRLDVVVTFLAVLELMKIGKIYLVQENLFDDMQIETLEEEGSQEELKLEGLDEVWQ